MQILEGNPLIFRGKTPLGIASVGWSTKIIKRQQQCFKGIKMYQGGIKGCQEVSGVSRSIKRYKKNTKGDQEVSRVSRVSRLSRSYRVSMVSQKRLIIGYLGIKDI